MAPSDSVRLGSSNGAIKVNKLYSMIDLSRWDLAAETSTMGGGGDAVLSIQSLFARSAGLGGRSSSSWGPRGGRLA